MKKFIKNSLLFLPLLILNYLFFICIWGIFTPDFMKRNLKYYNEGFSRNRLNEAKEVKNVDILILGSSHSYLGIDTRTFNNIGYSAFNLGTTAQTPIQTELLLNRYLNSINPKIIVYEVNPAGFSSDGIESSFDIIGSEKIDKDIFELAFKQNHISVYNSLIYSICEFVSNKKNDLNTSCKDYKYISGGFVQKEISYFKNLPNFPLNYLEIQPEQLNSFKRSIRQIRLKKIELILVQAPITNAKYSSYSNNNSFNLMMSQFGDYYNYNEIMSLNDSLDFFDDHHLNSNGVRKFDNKLIETLHLDARTNSIKN